MFSPSRLVYCLIYIAIDHLHLDRFAPVVQEEADTCCQQVNAEEADSCADETEHNRHDKKSLFGDAGRKEGSRKDSCYSSDVNKGLCLDNIVLLFAMVIAMLSS